MCYYERKEMTSITQIKQRDLPTTWILSNIFKFMTNVISIMINLEIYKNICHNELEFKKENKDLFKASLWVKSSISNRNVMTEHFHRFRQLVSWEHIWCAQTFLLTISFNRNMIQIRFTTLKYVFHLNATQSIQWVTCSPNTCSLTR